MGNSTYNLKQEKLSLKKSLVLTNPQEIRSTLSSALKRRLISGGSWALTGKVVTAIIGLGVNALLVRLLTPKEVGAYFLTFTLVSVAAVLAQLGLNQTVTRLVAESLSTGKPGRARAAILIVFRFGALGALFTAGILIIIVGHWLALHVFDSELIGGVIGLAAAWVVIITFQNLLAETFRGFHDIRLATIFGGQHLGGLAAGMIAAALFTLLWMLRGYSNLSQVIFIVIIAGSSSVLFGGLLLCRKVRGLKGNEQLKGREVIAIAWPLLITNFTVFALIQADIWILGTFRSQEDVAIYGAVVRMVALVTLPLIVVNAVVPPLITEMYTQGRIKELGQVLRKTTTIATIPALIVLICFITFGELILNIVYGNYYREGAIVLAILSLGQLVNVWAGPCGITLVMTGHQARLMSITVFCGLLIVTGAMLMVSIYGAIGIASVVTAGMILQNILMLLAVRQKIGVWTHAQFTTLPVIRHVLLR